MFRRKCRSSKVSTYWSAPNIISIDRVVGPTLLHDFSMCSIANNFLFLFTGLQAKQTPIVIEETHEILPESHVKYSSPAKIVHHYPVKGHHQTKIYPVQISRPNTHFLVEIVPSSVRRKHESGIPDLLAVLAPLAAIPLLGSLAVSSFTTMLTLTGLGRRRRRRDLTLHQNVLHQLTTHDRHNVSLLHLDLINGTTDAQSDLSPLVNATSEQQQHSFSKDLPIFGDLSAGPKTSVIFFIFFF